MGGLAKIARERGHVVTGCDAQVYPPMSDQLRALGIQLHEGYDAEQLDRYQADLYVVGNAMMRGMPVVEEMLEPRPAVRLGPAVALRERAAGQVGDPGRGHARQVHDLVDGRVDPRATRASIPASSSAASRATSTSRRSRPTRPSS